jgi:CBS domain-containing protein
MQTTKMQTMKSVAARWLTLRAATAAELMTPNPVSLRAQATVLEARELFIAKAFTAAPVIDAAGRPVGVLSQSDIMVHQAGPDGGDQATVEDLMTPAVFGVSPETPACEVVESLLALRVHHLYVLDAEGVLIGVIGALDVVRHLRGRGNHSED